MGTEEDLDETVQLAQLAGGKVLSAIADVRSFDTVSSVVRRGLDAFGSIDIVVANAGIFATPMPVWEIDPVDFQAVVDVDLLGVWNTMRAALPAMVASGRGGSVVVTASGAAVKGSPNISSYVAAKHGLLGLIKSAARELGPHHIRVNAVLPGNANTPMFRNDAMMQLFVPDQEEPDEGEFLRRAAANIPLGVPFVEASDITEAVVWLSSPRARYITGVALPVDGGSSIP